MDSIKQTIQKLIDYVVSLEPHKPVPAILASLADATNEETVRLFVMLLLSWLYYNGRYHSGDRLVQRENKMSIFVVKAITDANQDGLKYVPVLCHVFAMNGDTLSYAATMSDADKLALELYVSEHYQIGTPHVLMKREDR